MEKDVLFYHGKTSDGYRFTIASAIVDDGIIDNLVTGVALCSKQDQFVKKTGRNKAKGKLLSTADKGKRKISLYTDTFESIKEEITGNPNFEKDWFHGIEMKVFIMYAKSFDYFSKNQLKDYFSL